ncbi:BspA family leucine-rich repeat surface protein [Lactiplantibacillus songbeiensis]|uniref:BspA family leucine-rich repeat surface protein n=1 Tax=Lactiplantibacillus songbeiensis TaxID=2559920 RepID=A0ABW4C3D2_9LACO|nr:BspA family leucine-rich repeat surface protein [Lactiplantibacillus songbeiensis]
MRHTQRLTSTTSPKVHYKMYKKGRFWLFAGIAVLTWQLSSPSAQADTDESSNSEADTSSTTSASQLSQSSVVLSSSSSSSSSQQSSTSSSSSSSNSSSSQDSSTSDGTNDGNATATTKATQTSSRSQTTENNDSDGQTAQKVGSSTTSSSSTLSSTSSSSSASSESSNSISETSSSDTSNTLTNAGQQSTDNSKTPTDQSAGTTDINQLTNVQSITDDLTADSSNQLLGANLMMSRLAMPVAANLTLGGTLTDRASLLRSAAATAATTVASGAFKAGATWVLDSDGVLTITGNGGGLDDTVFNAGTGNSASPWAAYATQIKSVVFDGPVKAAANSSDLFTNMTNLTTVENANNFDTSTATSLFQMFRGDTALTSINVSNWDTSKVTNMADMFNDTAALTTLDVSGWQTGNVTNIANMFWGDAALTTLDVSKWDTSKVTDMAYAFYNNKALATLDVSNWQTGQMTDMAYAFTNDSSLTTLDVSGWDTANVTNMNRLFNGDSGLTTIDVSNWNTGKVGTAPIDTSIALSLPGMAYMFAGDKALTSLGTLGTTNWDTSHVQDMQWMFEGDGNLGTVEVSNWNTGNVTNMAYMFGMAGISNKVLTSLDVSKWNTSKVTQMQSMFNSDSALATLDVSGWDTSKVTNMNSMFSNDSALTALDVSGWNTGSVKDLSATFSGVSKVKVLDVSNWNTANVTTLGNTFYNDSGISKLDVSKWNTSQVTSMSETFGGVTGVATFDVKNWDTSNVTTMHYMFYRTSKNVNGVATGLETLDLSSWNTKKVTDMTYMFTYDAALTNANLTGLVDGSAVTLNHMFDSAAVVNVTGLDTWDTSKATSMAYMFASATTGTTLDLSKWQTAAVTDMTGMFANNQNKTLENLDLSNFTMSDSTKISNMLASLASLKTISLGKNTLLSNSTGNAGLRELVPTEAYTDRWVNNEKALNTTDSLTTLYSSPATAVADTYTIQTNQTKLVPADAITITVNPALTGTAATWQASQGLTTAIDYYGDPLDPATLATVTKDGNAYTGTTIDLTTNAAAGVYQILYSYTDPSLTRGATTMVGTTVTVLANQASFKVNPTATVIAGDPAWTPANDFVSATDVDGTSLKYTDLTNLTVTYTNADNQAVTEAAVLSNPGAYTVTYAFDDSQGNPQTATTALTVAANQAGLTATDTALYTTDTWRPDAGLVATEPDGTKVNTTNGVTYTITDQTTGTAVTSLDTTKPGTYTVDYQFTDTQGKTWSKAVTVTVKDGTAAVDTGDDQTLYTGNQYVPSPVSAVNADGSEVKTGLTTTIKDAATGQPVSAIETTKAGTYIVTTSFVDQNGQTQSGASKVTIVDNSGAATPGIDQKLYTGDAYVPSSASAKYADGLAVAAKDITTTITDTTTNTPVAAIDTNKAGNYTITTSFTDKSGAVQSGTSTVTIVDSRGAIQPGTDQTLYTGNDYTPSEVVAKYADGSSVAPGDLTTTIKNAANEPVSSIDTAQAGTYTVTTSFTDQSGKVQSGTSTVTIVDNSDVVKSGPDQTLYTGNDYTQNKVSATYANGDTVAPADLTTTIIDATTGNEVAAIDTGKAGVYKVITSFTDQNGKTQSGTSKVTIVDNSGAVQPGANQTLYTGNTYTPSAVVAKYADGSTVASDKVTTTIKNAANETVSSIDTTQAGTYTVTTSFTDQSGKVQSGTSTVTIVNNTSAVQTGANQTLYTGDDYTPSAILAKYADGTTVATNQLTTTIVDATTGDSVAAIDTKKAGNYIVTTSFTDQNGKTQSGSSTVTIVDNSGAVKPGTNQTLYTGNTYTPSTVVVTYADGSTVASDKLTTTIKNAANEPVSAIDMTRAGTYTVTTSFTDQNGKVQSGTSTVTIVDNSDAVQPGTDQTLYTGNTYTPSAVTATYADGSSVAADKLTTTITDNATKQMVSTIDTTKPGSYTVMTQFTDQNGQIQSGTSQVTIVTNTSAVDAGTGQTLYQGDTYTANTVSATYADGHKVPANELTTTITKDGQSVAAVTPDQAGTYTITTSFTDRNGKVQTGQSTVTIKPTAGAITAGADQTLYVGDTYQASAVTAINADGTPADASVVTTTYTRDGQPVTGVDSSVSGQYVITSTFNDGHGQNLTTSSTVTVKALTGTIQANDATLYVGDTTWEPSHSLVSATDSADMDVTAQVVTTIKTAAGTIVSALDTSTPGTYQVTYSFKDVNGQTKSKTIAVTIVAASDAIRLADKTSFVVGDTWTPITNLTAATDIDGSDATAKVTYQVTQNGQVVSDVDMQQAGTYEVTYQFTNQQGQVTRQTQTVTVNASQAAITLTGQTAIPAGSTWTPAENLAKVTNTDGSSVDASQVTVNITKDGQPVTSVDTSKVGTYVVTYSFTNQQGQLTTQSQTVTVAANQAVISLTPRTTIVAGSTWTPTANLARVTDVDGTPVAADQVAIKVTKAGQPVSGVDTKQAGTYVVTYQFTNQLGVVTTASQTITVVANQAVLTVMPTVAVTAGTTWQPVSAILSAVNTDGSTINPNSLMVTVTKNGQPVATTATMTAGTYVVTYSFVDATGQTQRAQTTVTVTATAPTGQTDVPTTTKPVTKPATNGTATAVIKPTKPTSTKPKVSVVPVVKADTNATWVGNTLRLAPQPRPTDQPAKLVKPIDTGTTVSDTKATTETTQNAAITVVPVKSAIKTVKSSTTAQDSAKAGAKTLPQTDETSATTPTLAGSLLLAFSSLLGVLGLAERKRR